MSSFDWQKAWDRRYNNQSDGRWKTKSLNPMSPEQYTINLPSAAKSNGGAPKGEPGVKQEQSKEEPLPSPKINKVNGSMFCITLEKELNLFYLQLAQDKVKKRSNKTFGKSEYGLGQKIVFVTGLTPQKDKNYLLVATVDKLILLKIVHQDYSYVIKPTESVSSIPQFRTLVSFGSNRIVAVSSTHFYQYELVDDKLRELVAKKIQFKSNGQEERFKALSPIGIVLGSGESFYFFGSKREQKVDQSKLKGVPGEVLFPGQCQALSIVQMKIQWTDDINQVKGEIFPIDHIFQLGIFSRTKIYEIERETFLISLHEQIILVKKNFCKYIVWDNVSVVSSKSESKKGQLALVAQTILAYSEKAEIYAHEIFFSAADNKLQMPTIDNFRGNDNDEQILYDALMLQTEDSIIKVLAYVKPQDVIYPNNESNMRRIETDPNKMKQVSTTLDFTVICINQNDPLKKLEQLIDKKKPNQEIQQFCERFKISEQNLLKCKWNVSSKKRKDIQSILMMIKDDEFIQSELDNILKESSHNLQFLSNVEAKQGERLRRLLTQKILEYTNETSLAKEKALKEYIFKILQWLMQSEMFLKKVKYSKNFLTFKQYDFIQIGKLRAASLKEEIKLLSCKKYEKRLKYFLNQFKTLVIANYEDVFNFLLSDRSVAEIREFIEAFRFILPHFTEPSEVFITRKQYNIIEKKELTVQKKKRDRHMSFNPIINNLAQELPHILRAAKMMENSKDKQSKIEVRKEKSGLGEGDVQGGDRCMLWQDLKEDKEIEETMQAFLKKQIGELKDKPKENLEKLLQEFQSLEWFKHAAFKQHCMIIQTSHEIHCQFNELKRKKAFKILIKFLYKQIDELDRKKIVNAKGQKESVLYESQANDMIEQFISDGFIPESFKRNVDARLRVYKDLLKPLANKRPDKNKKMMAIDLPILQEFVTKGQPEYFQQIFSHIRSQILGSVKAIYDDIETGFFRERFQMFLKSDMVTPLDVISFLDQFNEDVQADDIRIEVFNAIKRLLRLTDRDNTTLYIKKSLDKQILPERDDGQNVKLRDEAKIPYGFYFYNLFVVFQLDCTYEQLIGFSNQRTLENNTIILDLVRKYCADDFVKDLDYDNKTICKIQFQEIGINDKLETTDIYHEPLEFFGLLLIFLDMLDFFTEEREVFELMMESYLNKGKFKELADFIMKLKNYHIRQTHYSTKNYQMISDFKEEVDIDGLFVGFTLEWIKRNYESISSLSVLDERMRFNDRALNMLEAFNRNSSQIRKERALFVILHFITKFQPSLALNVQFIKDEAVRHGSFMFLMHIFNKIGASFTDKQRYDQTEKVEYLFKIFQSHQEHVLSQKVDYFHPEFLRFLIEVCIKMIEQSEFAMARYLILYKIPNENEYFRDVLLLFLAAGKREEGTTSSFSSDVVKMILTPETTSLIRNNLETIIDKYQIKSFISLKAEAVAPVVQRYERMSIRPDMKAEGKMADERPEEKSQFHKKTCEIFKWTMSKYRKSDAFFLLVRARIVKNDDLKAAAKGYFSSFSDVYDQEKQNIEFYSYCLATSYLKTLEMFVQKEFYPTFAFFQSKVLLLQDQKERTDIIKDINIAMSKLDRLIRQIEKEKEKQENDKPNQKEKQKEKVPKNLLDLRSQLQNYYNEYMSAVGEDPDIKLADSYTKGTTATVKTEIYARTRNIAQEEQQMHRQVGQHKKAIQQNINRAYEVQQDSRLNVLNRQINEHISDIRKGTERQTMMEAEMKRQEKEKEPNIAEKKAREFEDIKRKERQDIESIKDTYKSNTTQRVNDLIDNLRKRRQEIKAKTYAPISPVRDEGRYSQMINPTMTSLGKNVAFNLHPAELPRVESIDNVMPTTIRMKRLQQGREEQKRGENKFVELQKKMFPEPTAPILYMPKKTNFDEIVNLYRERESAQALQCIQKYDMLKNPNVRMELIKRAYAITSNLDCFLQFLKFLIETDSSWKESIEDKSIPIAGQMIKMEPKEKITIKEIIPAEFFTRVTKVSLKDYYSIAFDLFKPSLKRIFEKDLMPVHGVGILFRYALGSENKIFNKVVYEYYTVILKAYETKNYDDKELTILAEKIRSNYSNLPDNKDQVLQELLSNVPSVKKSRLLEAIKKITERKGQSLVGGHANKEISYVLQKLMKM